MQRREVVWSSAWLGAIGAVLLQLTPVALGRGWLLQFCLPAGRTSNTNTCSVRGMSLSAVRRSKVQGCGCGPVTAGWVTVLTWRAASWRAMFCRNSSSSSSSISSSANPAHKNKGSQYNPSSQYRQAWVHDREEQ